MSDLIARLQGPFLPSANGAYDGGIRLPLEARQELMDAAAIRIEAAAALAAQDAEIAALRARLAAAEVLAEKAGALCSPWLARHNPTREMEETVAALAAYKAAKEASDE